MAELASGLFLTGGRFFSNRKICRLWRVSETTAKTALAWLVNARLVEVRNRSGYYVAPGAQEQALFLLYRDGFPKLAAPATWETRRYTLRLQTEAPQLCIGIIRPGESLSSVAAADTLSTSPELRGLFMALRREGVECRYYIDNQTPESRREIAQLARQHGLHGVVAFRRNKESYVPLEPLIRAISGRALPVVTVLDDCEGLNVVSVNVNNVALGYRAARHLLRNRHRRIAVVYPNQHNYYFFDRVLGCRRAVEERSGSHLLELSEEELASPGGAQRLFGRGSERPTGVFLTSYDQVAPVLAMLRRRRLRVPEEVSLLVCRRSSTGGNVSGLPLDAMAIPFEALGKLAAETILKLLRGKPTSRTNLVSATLVKAGSVASS